MRCGIFSPTFRTRDNRTALVRFLLHFAVFANRLDERTHPQVAHQHLVVARTVQAWFIRDYAISFVVMLEIVITASSVGHYSKIIFVRLVWRYFYERLG